mmetsp:Transcript_1132/g.2660  ORF Transcript_1132/g.2660 Transcript_1132/m.2660 type:complete len:203 (-) Transcript_1132:734-1342(-)
MLAKMVCSCSRFRSEVAGSLILDKTALSCSVRLDNKAFRRSCSSSRFLLASKTPLDSSVILPLAIIGILGTTGVFTIGGVASTGTSSGARCPAFPRQGRRPMLGSFSTGKRMASSASSRRLKVTIASCRTWLICNDETGPKRPKYSLSTSILFTLGGTCITTMLTPPFSLRSNRGPFRDGGGCEGGGPATYGPRQVSGGLGG